MWVAFFVGESQPYYAASITPNTLKRYLHHQPC